MKIHLQTYISARFFAWHEFCTNTSTNWASDSRDYTCIFGELLEQPSLKQLSLFYCCCHTLVLLLLMLFVALRLLNRKSSYTTRQLDSGTAGGTGLLRVGCATCTRRQTEVRLPFGQSESHNRRQSRSWGLLAMLLPRQQPHSDLCAGQFMRYPVSSGQCSACSCL